MHLQASGELFTLNSNSFARIVPNTFAPPKITFCSILHVYFGVKSSNLRQKLAKCTTYSVPKAFSLTQNDTRFVPKVFAKSLQQLKPYLNQEVVTRPLFPAEAPQDIVVNISAIKLESGTLHFVLSCKIKKIKSFPDYLGSTV